MMGTRHLICVQHEGKYKVAQYGQWDGYPSGQGLTVLEFLREQFDREKFLARLAETFEPTIDQIKDMYRRAGADEQSIEGGWINMDVSRRFKDANPSLHRDTGAKILALIQESTEPVPLRLDVEFAADSLSCEYAYVIDLDKNTFEVFEGYNKEPVAPGQRFADLALDEDRMAFSGHNGEPTYRYYHVKLAAGWSLNAALPDEEAFLAKLEPQEDEESDETADN